MFGGGGNSGFTFGQPQGQQQQQGQQQGQTGGLFGQQQQQPQQNAFGQPQSSGAFGSGGFGAQQQSQPAGGGLFGQANNNAQPASGGFSFGGQQQQQPAAGGFGAAARPATTFGGGFGGGATSNTGSTFSFGANNNAQQQQPQSNPFGAAPAANNPFGAKPAGGGLFGGAAPQQQQQQPASGGLFGQQPQQAAGGGLFGGAGAAGAPGAQVTQGSSNPPYQVSVLQEKDASNNTTSFAYQSISCMQPYKGMSFEELRVQDYEQGRKSGNASGPSTSGGFGFGQQNQQQGQTSTFGGGGAFGQQQQQPQQGGGLFGAQNNQQQSGGLFGGQQQQQPASGGLFGQQSNQQSGGLFGGQQQQQQQPASTGFSFGGNNTQQQQQPASTGFSFGGAAQSNSNTANKPLFGGFGSTQPSTNTGTGGGFSFGGQQQQPQQQPGQTGAFGSTGATGGGFSFGGAANNAPKPGGLFGSSQPAATSSAPAFGGFGAAASSGAATANKPAFSFGGTSSSGTGFGAQPAPSTGGGLFGGGAATSQPMTTSAPAAGGSLFGGFGQQNDQQQPGQQGQQPGQTGGLFGGGAGGTSGGLFGGAAGAAKPGGLFGSSTTTSQPTGQTGFGAGGTTGGFSFGGANNQQQGQQQQKPGGFSFGQSTTGAAGGGGLFGGGAGATGGGGLFGSSTTGAGGSSLFGNNTAGQAGAGGGGLFGSSTAGGQAGGLFGSQSGQPANLPPQGVGLTSDPYGTDALFKSIGAGGAVNQPALPFNVSTSGPQQGPSPLSASVRSKPLPAPMMSPFRANPKNASRIARLRAGGTPARDSSPSAGANGLFGRRSSPALNGPGGLFQGLSDEVGSPSADSGLPSQAFVGRSNVKRLILNDNGGDRSTWGGRSVRAGTEAVDGTPGTAGKESVFGGRSGTVPPKALGGVGSAGKSIAFSPALETGLGRRGNAAPADETSFGDTSLQRSRSNLFAETPSKANHVLPSKGRDLFATSAAPASEREPTLDELPEGAYHVSPSLRQLRQLSFQRLSSVPDLTVTRKGFGSVRFLDPVDLTGINDLATIPGGIVQLREKEIWVYPQREDLAAGQDGMQSGYERRPVPKAEEGKGLNVPAEVSLELCWPLDKATKQPVKGDANHPRVKQHIGKLKKKAETRFIEYDAASGRWTFEVDHFSRYGLDPNDTSDSEEEKRKVRGKKGQQQRRTAQDGSSDGDSAEDDDAPPPRRTLRGPPSLTSASSEDGTYDDDDEELASQASSVEMPALDDIKESTPRRRPLASSRAQRQSSATPRRGESVSRATPQPQPWAAQVGVEPRRVQVMQASFFGRRAPGEVTEEDEREEQARTPRWKESKEEETSAIGGKRKTAPSAGTDAQSKDYSESRDTARRLEEEAKIPHLTTVQSVTRKLTRVDLHHSVAFGNDTVPPPLDAGFALGRSFRVGWGPGGMLVHAGTVQGVLSADRVKAAAEKPAQSSTLTLEKARVFGKGHTAEEEEAKKAERLLELQLAQSIVVSSSEEQEDAEDMEELVDTDDCPFIYPQSSLRFQHFASKFEASDRSHEALLWRLGKALFDEVDHLRLPTNASNDLTQTITTLRRKAALSSWLAHAVSPSAEQECRGHVAANRSAAQVVFSHLTANQVEKACVAALDAGDVRLATLLAQLGGGDDETRADVAEQLAIWRAQGVDAHIDREHRRVYELLAGNVTVSQGNTGAGNRSARDPMDRVEDVPIAAGLDWKRAFGLHLWYGTSFDSPLTAAFDRYEAASSTSSGDTAPPLPPYREKSNLGTLRLRELLKTGSYDRDALFYLVKLYAHPTFDLETALSPFGFGPTLADYRLPWHLYVLLSRVLRRRDFSDRLELGIDAPEGVEGNSTRADNLTADYAHQLELQGQWTWAAFVLLHLELPASRRAAVKALLSRSVARLGEEGGKEWDFLTLRLKVPSSWLYEAQALQARQREDRYDEYSLLLKAELFERAHAIAVRDLAPEAIIRGDVNVLFELFAPFTEAFEEQVGDDLPGWTVGGQLYLDYVACVEQLPHLISVVSASREAAEGGDNVKAATDPVALERLNRLAPRVAELLDLVPEHLFPPPPPTVASGRAPQEGFASLGQLVARSDMLAALHNLQRVLTVRALLPGAGDGKEVGGVPAMAPGVAVEAEHVQNAAGDYLALLMKAGGDDEDEDEDEVLME
ncbi:hypothetical protein BDZ90DRAFT_275689 [Jaminaea rosea]|uniref:Peptidase S59 domain-containing protein n=1 Tax=Jaminaea rosea TaxID=1569628 RepID=A0A316UKI9_9BASI|nr:hypothetical protein BDZ90DRAFT_275689 [Jaminaea rosea]PWN25812.1 hypothetical protein BDZ90DRAFT_275689 [Jaminaea rosea]